MKACKASAENSAIDHCYKRPIIDLVSTLAYQFQSYLGLGFDCNRLVA